ncbi:MAG: DMP19 family protein [Aureliella sp.]
MKLRFLGLGIVSVISESRLHMSNYRYDISEILDEHVDGPYDPEEREFIEEIASALYERVDDMPAVEQWPAPVKYFYACYEFNYQVGNGGFAQAAFNVPGLFPIATQAFEHLGLVDAAQLCRRATAMLPQEIAAHLEKGILDTDSLEEVFEHFDDSPLAELDEDIPEEFWADAELQKLVEDNREAFLAIDALLS